MNQHQNHLFCPNIPERLSIIVCSILLDFNNIKRIVVFTHNFNGTIMIIIELIPIVSIIEKYKFTNLAITITKQIAELGFEQSVKTV